MTWGCALHFRRTVLAALTITAALPVLTQTNLTSSPVLSPGSGSYTTALSVEITDTDTIASVYYTTDGTIPTTDSTLYNGPIAIGIGTTVIQAFAVDNQEELLPSTVVKATYVVAPTNATVNLTATPNPLILPGILKLTSVVNPTPAGGAVPTGTVSFSSDGVKKLGSAPLSIVPSTQAWTGGATLASPISNPIGLASVILTKGGLPAIVSADYSSDSVVLYKFSASGTSLNAFTYNPFSGAGFAKFSAGDQGGTTNGGIASGYFLQPKSSGIQSFLVNDPYNLEYLVFDGSTTSSGTQLKLNAPTQVSTSGCNCASYNDVVIAVDDFDGDGYSDVASLYRDSPVAGITLNLGVSDPGSFGTSSQYAYTSLFIDAPTPTLTAPYETFCPLAITTGHFTSDTVAQLAVLARTPVSNQCGAYVPADPTTVYLYQLGKDPNGANILIQVGTPLVLTDTNATSLAAADLNLDKKTDLIIGETITSTAQPSGGVRTVLGRGDGSFETPSPLVTPLGPPIEFNINDFNGDGYPDLAYTNIGSFGVILNDGTGILKTIEGFGYTPATTTAPGGIISADLNGDGLADLATVPGSPSASYNTIDILLNSASSRAVFTTAISPLDAGTHNLTATYSGDNNFAPASSLGLSEVVDQTTPTIVWPTPAGIDYGTPLSAAQLNATANIPGAFSYNPAAGKVLPPGANTITATFIPTDTGNYSVAVATQTITVAPPVLLSISPASVSLSNSDVTITATGRGFVNGAVVKFNGNSLVTTYVDQEHLTAVFPATMLVKPGSGAITVVDPGGLVAAGSQTFSVTAQPPVATVSATESTVTAGNTSTVNLTLNPYPVQVTATATLVFTPAPPIAVGDPAVLFDNGATTESLPIAPSATASATPFSFQSGSTAGTITVTIHLTLDGGQDVTPPTLTPVTITVPAGPPILQSPVLTRSGKTLTVTVIALSSTRDMTEAQFHFTAATGKSIKTPDVTVPLTTAFQAWYGTTGSEAFGTSFTYTQVFTIDGDAADVGSVTFTMANSNGSSEPATAQ